MTTIITALLVIASAIAPDLDLDRVVPHSTWLARCSAVPTDALDGIEISPASTRPGVVEWELRQGTRVGVLRAYRLGVYAGIPVYAVRGPTVLRDRMALDPACPQVKTWPEVRDLPAAVVAWIAERSTCCGSATVGGMEYAAWPCAWELVAGRVTVARRDGFGPGVVGSNAPCEGYAPPL